MSKNTIDRQYREQGPLYCQLILVVEYFFILLHVSVVVNFQFYPWFKIYFPLLLGI